MLTLITSQKRKEKYKKSNEIRNSLRSFHESSVIYLNFYETFLITRNSIPQRHVEMIVTVEIGLVEVYV